MSNASARASCARPSSRQRGFTLIEATASLTSFAFALSGLSFLLAATIDANAQARRLAVATQLAQAGLENLLASGETVDGADPGDPLTGSASGVSYRRTWTVTAGAPAPGLSTVNVSVAWTDGNGEHSVTLAGVVPP